MAAVKTAVVTAYVSPETARELQIAAMVRHEKMSDMVREILEKFLAEQPRYQLVPAVSQVAAE